MQNDSPLRRLGWLLLAPVAVWLHACTPARPYYTGPGSYGATMPYQTRPAWLGRDTAVTYVSGYGGAAMRYNEFDENLAFGGQVHRAWVTQNFALSAGAFGSRGRYTYGPNYNGPALAELRYGSGGLEVGGSIKPSNRAPTVHRFGVEWRVLNAHLSIAREWGQASDWRRNPTDRTTGQPLEFTSPIGQSDWLKASSVGTELMTRSPRPNAPTIGLGGGFLMRGVDGSAYANLILGVGPLLLTGQIAGPGQYASSKPVWQFGLTYGIRNKRH